MDKKFELSDNLKLTLVKYKFSSYKNSDSCGYSYISFNEKSNKYELWSEQFDDVLVAFSDTFEECEKIFLKPHKKNKKYVEVIEKRYE